MRAFLLAAGIALGAASAFAVPAKPTPVKFTQPDGTEIMVQLRGDERHHWYQTEDGYLLANIDNTFYYAGVDASGNIVNSSLEAHPAGMRSETERAYLKNVDMSRVTAALKEQRMRSPRLRSENAIHRKAAQKARASQKAEAASATPADVSNYYGKGLFPGTHFPNKGEQKGLVILVEYQDVKFTDPAANYGNDVNSYFNEMLNGETFTKFGATGSVRQWFLDNSAGQFQPQFDVYGPVTLPNNMAYYGGNDITTGEDINPQMMAVHACQILDDTVDFSQYDRDSDGYIDNAYIIFAGRGEASGGSADTVWPHSWNVSAGSYSEYIFDGVILDRYGCSNEWEGNKPDGIGTFMHEFSHVMGLPDIYPTEYTDAFTPGDYCVMDYGNYNNDGCTPPNYGIFERNALGWMKPAQLTGDEFKSYTINPISEMDGYVIATNRADEFFLVENRQMTGWDRFIPGHGMLLWHIDYASNIWTINAVNNNADHQYVDIMEADGIRTKDSRAGDTFPGTRNVTAVTHRTSPALRTWAGVNIKVPMKNIAETDGIITFDGGYTPLPPPGKIQALEVAEADLTPTSFTARWTTSASASAYLVTITNQAGRNLWEAKNVGNVDNATIAGLNPDSDYSFFVIPVNEDSEGEPSNRVSVHTLKPTLDFLKTKSLPASDISDTSFTANWEPVEMATEYIINVTERQATPLNEVTANFDGGHTDMPDGWKSTVAATCSDPSLCGTSAPAIRFEKKGFLLSDRYDEDIKEVAFHYHAISTGDASCINVKGTVTGSSAWNTIAKVTLTDGEGDFRTDNIPANLNGLFIEFTDGQSCSLILDDIKVVYGGTVISESPLEPYINYSAGNTPFAVISGLEPATEYTYTVQAYNATHHAKVSDPVTIRTKASAGIGSIEADPSDAPVEYYNLQGIRVADPAPGVYIRRQGNKAAKVLIR